MSGVIFALVYVGVAFISMTPGVPYVQTWSISIPAGSTSTQGLLVLQM